MAKKIKKELSAQEVAVVSAIKNSLDNNFNLKSTTPQKKCIEGQTRFTMWVEKSESKERFLVYLKNNGDLKYLSEEFVNMMRRNNCLKTIK